MRLALARLKHSFARAMASDTDESFEKNSVKNYSWPYLSGERQVQKESEKHTCRENAKER